MTGIVIGIASSHTPQLSSGVDMWSDHAERDRRNPRLLGKDARFHTYDELLATADPGLARELDPAVWEEKYQRSQTAAVLDYIPGYRTLAGTGAGMAFARWEVGGQ